MWLGLQPSIYVECIRNIRFFLISVDRYYKNVQAQKPRPTPIQGCPIQRFVPDLQGSTRSERTELGAIDVTDGIKVKYSLGGWYIQVLFK
jgi:hypothetical protein